MKRTKPEQSNPLGVWPPKRYLVPKYLLTLLKKLCIEAVRRVEPAAGAACTVVSDARSQNAVLGSANGKTDVATHITLTEKVRTIFFRERLTLANEENGCWGGIRILL